MEDDIEISDLPGADHIGIGMCLAESGSVGIVLMLGDHVDEEEITLGSIVLDYTSTERIVGKLQELMVEMKMAEEAVKEMGTDAAREYLNNWARRINSQLN